MSSLILPPMDALPGYTPVRRRPQPPFGDNSPVHAQVPWTTARCNRLLRPIASRILLLRKGNNSKPTVPVANIPTSQPLRQVGKSRKRAPSQECSPIRCRALAETSANGDPEWVPRPIIRGRIKHKYSSRTTGNRIHRKNLDEPNLPGSLPGEVTIATPIITQKARPYANAQGAIEDITAPDQDPESGVYAAEGRKRRKLQNCPSRRCEGDPVPHDMRQKLKKVVTPSRWMLIDGLYNGLDALLKGTAEATRLQNCGARSLFSVCLRKVPGYIAAEQSWHDSQDDDNDVDVCSEVYNHLENIGSTSGDGWKPLREVVRAHGVAMLGDAIREGLIDHTIGRGLVFLCIHALAFNEAEKLLDCLISSLGAGSRPSSVYSKLFDIDATACLGTLDVYASRSGRHGFQHRQLEKLLRTRILPIEWVATTEFAPTWARVVQSISHGDQDYSDAAQLIITAVTLACGFADQSASSLAQELRLNWLEGERISNVIAEPGMPFADGSTKSKNVDDGLGIALSNTISSLMAILYAINITQLNKSQPERLLGLPHSNKSASALLERLNLDVLRKLDLTCRSSSKGDTSTTYRRRTVTVILASLLVAQELQGNQTSIHGHRLPRTLENIAALSTLCKHNVPDTASQVASVVSSIARCCAKASPDQEFDHLQKLTNRLASIAGDKTAITETRQLFAYFTLTTAMEYAQDTGNNWHIEWALEVEERVTKDSRAFIQNLAKTPYKSDGASPEGYRWEEGICEWIAKTPKIKSEQLSTSHELSDMPSKAYRQSSRLLHREVSSFDIPSGGSKPSPIGSEDASRVISTRDSKGAVNGLQRQNGTHIFATQHANTAGHALRVRPQSRTDGQKWPLRPGIPDAGPNSSWKLQADKHEDELATLDSLGKQSKSRGWKLGITALGSACHSQSKDSRQALRSSKCPALRFPHASRQPVVASVFLEDESADELGV